MQTPTQRITYKVCAAEDAWNFLHGAMHDCDSSVDHTRSMAWTTHVIFLLLPALRGLAMAIIKPHGSSSSLNAQCYTLYLLTLLCHKIHDV